MGEPTLLITGGTGSFGQRFIEIALRENLYKAIRIYSRSEYLQDQMARKFHDDRLRFLIGDIRDKERLYMAMDGVDVVLHAAALKHVTICEYNVYEAISTNILGAMNIAQASIEKGVKKAIFISTDKACQPISTYGATKMVAEKVFVQSNVYAGKKNTRFSCVRYGNVVGSRGSMIPLFYKQRDVGEITITDRRMTRFWITLEQGVRFILNCLDGMRGGEVFIPKLPSMKVIDMANAIAPKAKIKVIGIRPGEKVHEILFTEEESRHTKEFDTYFVIIPEYRFWGDYELDGVFTKITHYASDKNTWWLTNDELIKMVEGLGE